MYFLLDSPSCVCVSDLMCETSVPQAVSDKLMAGFVECLDNEEAEEGTENGDGERDALLSVKVLLCLKTLPSSAFDLNPAVLILWLPPNFRLWRTKESCKNPTRNPDPYPEPAHHISGAEDAQSGPVSFGLWSQETRVLHEPPGPRSVHNFSCWRVYFGCDLSIICGVLLWMEKGSWWPEGYLSVGRCIRVLQVCWDVHGAAYTPSWVCCREALRRDQDLYSHSRPHTWLSSATRYLHPLLKEIRLFHMDTSLYFCILCPVGWVYIWNLCVVSLSQVIYQLCACSDTSGPTMRYLRTSQDFLFSHLQHLPFILPSEYRIPADLLGPKIIYNNKSITEERWWVNSLNKEAGCGNAGNVEH